MSAKSNNTVWHQFSVTRERREEPNGQRSAVMWFTGLSASGKSTIAHAVEGELHRMRCRTYVFDGDNVRHGLCSNLGFSDRDRHENIQRIGEMVRLFLDPGIIAFTASIPHRKDRERIRELVRPENSAEVYCRCPIETCEKRDTRAFISGHVVVRSRTAPGVSAPS